MNREELYQFKKDDSECFNPYSFDNYPAKGQIDKLVLKKVHDALKMFQHVKTDFVSSECRHDGQRLLELLLRNVPHNAFYHEDHINESNVLFITNEPGLTKTYPLFASVVKNPTADEISNCFNLSMHSWLSLSEHQQTKKVNGDNLPQEGMKQFKFGKIGYFFNEKEKSIKTQKVIHLDLFPYAQSDAGDINERNDKKNISDKINEKTLDLDSGDVDVLLNSIIDSNLSIIKKFIKNANHSSTKTYYVFIIGNRVLPFEEGSVDGYIPNLNYVKSQDNRAIAAKIIHYILEFNNGKNIDIRVSKQWPYKLKTIDLYRPTIIDIKNKKTTIEFEIIKSEDTATT